MRRSAALTSFSHDHHHALEVARRLRRATFQDVDGAVAYLHAFWDGEVRRHFELEEEHLTGALMQPEWRAGIGTLLHDTSASRSASSFRCSRIA